MHTGVTHAEFIQIINGRPALPDGLADFFTDDEIIDLGLQAPQQILTNKRLKDMFNQTVIKQQELYEPLGEYLYNQRVLLGPRFIASDIPSIANYNKQWTPCALEARLKTVSDEHTNAYIGGILPAQNKYFSNQLVYSTQTHQDKEHVFLQQARTTSIWNVRILVPTTEY